MNKLDRKAVFLLAAESLFDLECSAEEFEQYSLTLLRLGKAIDAQEKKSAELYEYRERLDKQAVEMQKELQKRIDAQRQKIESITDVENLLKLKSEQLEIQIIEKMNSESMIRTIESAIQGRILSALGIERHNYSNNNSNITYHLDSKSPLRSVIANMLEPTVKKLNEDISNYARSPLATEKLEEGLDIEAVIQRFSKTYRDELYKRIEGTWSDQIRKLTDQRLLELRKQAESTDPTIAMELLTWILSLQLKN